MTVTPYPKDADGAALSARVTNATTAYNAIASTSNATKNAAAIALDKAQRELVEHYMNVGRLTAANILSTMT